MAAAKSDEDLELDGTHRPDRHERKALPHAAVEPENLTEEQQALWDELAPQWPDADLGVQLLLESLVMQITRLRDARKEINNRGQLIEINAGQTTVLNPAVGVAERAEKSILSTLQKLGKKSPAAKSAATLVDPREKVMKDE